MQTPLETASTRIVSRRDVHIGFCARSEYCTGGAPGNSVKANQMAKGKLQMAKVVDSARQTTKDDGLSHRLAQQHGLAIVKTLSDFGHSILALILVLDQRGKLSCVL